MRSGGDQGTNKTSVHLLPPLYANSRDLIERCWAMPEAVIERAAVPKECPATTLYRNLLRLPQRVRWNPKRIMIPKDGLVRRGQFTFGQRSFFMVLGPVHR